MLRWKVKAKVSEKRTNKENNQGDAECLVRGEKYSKTKSNELFQCTVCPKWAHKSCTGCKGADLIFSCVQKLQIIW